MPFSSIAPLVKMGISLNGKHLLPGGAVPYGMDNHFYHIRRHPLNVSIFISHVDNCVMGATPMQKGIKLLSMQFF